MLIYMNASADLRRSGPRQNRSTDDQLATLGDAERRDLLKAILSPERFAEVAENVAALALAARTAADARFFCRKSPALLTDEEHRRWGREIKEAEAVALAGHCAPDAPSAASGAELNVCRQLLEEVFRGLFSTELTMVERTVLAYWLDPQFATQEQRAADLGIHSGTFGNRLKKALKKVRDARNELTAQQTAHGQACRDCCDLLFGQPGETVRLFARVLGLPWAEDNVRAEEDPQHDDADSVGETGAHRDFPEPTKPPG